MVLVVCLLIACRQPSPPVTESGSPAAFPGNASSRVPEIAPVMVVVQEGDEVWTDVALLALGEGLYITHCAPCHQANGEGNLTIFPALNRNPFVTVHDPRAVIATVLHGRGTMPSFDDALSAEEIAAILSYVRQAWNNGAGTVQPDQVRQQMDETE